MRFSYPRLVVFILLVLGGCAVPLAQQADHARIPNTSVEPTTAFASTPGASGGLFATPSPVLLPSSSIFQPTRETELLAAPTADLLPTRTHTPQPIKVDPACMVGMWHVAELPSAMAESYAQSGSALQLQSVEGQAEYIFDASGSMAIAFDHLNATFTGNIDNRDVTVRQGLDGSGTAHYQLNPAEGQVILSNFGGQGLLSTLDINDQRIAEGNMPVWQAFTSSLNNDPSAPTSLVEYSRAQVTCSADTMTIQAIEPFPGPVVKLSKEK